MIHQHFCSLALGMLILHRFDKGLCRHYSTLGPPWYSLLFRPSRSHCTAKWCLRQISRNQWANREGPWETVSAPCRLRPSLLPLV